MSRSCYIATMIAKFGSTSAFKTATPVGIVYDAETISTSYFATQSRANFRGYRRRDDKRVTSACDRCRDRFQVSPNVQRVPRDNCSGSFDLCTQVGITSRIQKLHYFIRCFRCRAHELAARGGTKGPENTRSQCARINTNTHATVSNNSDVENDLPGKGGLGGREGQRERKRARS